MLIICSAEKTWYVLVGGWCWSFSKTGFSQQVSDLWHHEPSRSYICEWNSCVILPWTVQVDEGARRFEWHSKHPLKKKIKSTFSFESYSMHKVVQHLQKVLVPYVVKKVLHKTLRRLRSIYVELRYLLFFWLKIVSWILPISDETYVDDATWRCIEW